MALIQDETVNRAGESRIDLHQRQVAKIGMSALRQPLCSSFETASSVINYKTAERRPHPPTPLPLGRGSPSSGNSANPEGARFFGVLYRLGFG
jgi:hypothetical protein